MDYFNDSNLYDKEYWKSGHEWLESQHILPFDANILNVQDIDQVLCNVSSYLKIPTSSVMNQLNFEEEWENGFEVGYCEFHLETVLEYERLFRLGKLSEVPEQWKTAKNWIKEYPALLGAKNIGHYLYRVAKENKHEIKRITVYNENYNRLNLYSRDTVNIAINGAK